MSSASSSAVDQGAALQNMVRCYVCKEEKPSVQCSVKRYDSDRVPRSWICSPCNLAKKAMHDIGGVFQTDEERAEFFGSAAGKSFSDLKQTAQATTTQRATRQHTETKRRTNPAFTETDLKELKRFQGEAGELALENLKANGVKFMCPTTKQTMYELPQYTSILDDTAQDETDHVDQVMGSKKLKREKGSGEQKTGKAGKAAKALPKPMAKKLENLIQGGERVQFQAAKTLAVAKDPQCVPFVPQHYIEKLTSVDASIKNWTDAMSKELKAEPPNKEAAAKLIADSKLDFDDHAYLMDKITGSHGAKFVE